MRTSPIALVAMSALLAGCAASAGVIQPSGPTVRTGAARVHRPPARQFVIVIVQENRTVDNLFQTQPGVDTQNFGIDSHGNTIPLAKLPLGSIYGTGHSHTAFTTECNAAPSSPGTCRMNGFDLNNCKSCPPNIPYSYVDPATIAPYTQLATQYAFADHVLQPNEGPSQPGHIYLIAGQSGTVNSHWYFAENSKPSDSGAQNCRAKSTVSVLQIDMTSAYPGTEGNPIFPCIDPPTILDELDQAAIAWRYYTPNTGSIWTAPYAVNHLFSNPVDKNRVITPETSIFDDITNHTLKAVSYVVPTAKNSDHPGQKMNDGGPAWVASIVNAVGNSTYWPNTSIFVVWDDWGGWFDHYVPTHAVNPFGGNPNPYEYGFRVPLLAIGAHAKSGYVSHTVRNSTAILHYIEDLYGLPSLGKLDAQTDDLADMFDNTAAPRAFHPVATGRVTIQSLRHARPDSTPVDDE